jgi:hypothetical protein
MPIPKVLNIIVILLGLYLIVANMADGWMGAAVISGVAFVLVGAKPFFKKDGGAPMGGGQQGGGM